MQFTVSSDFSQTLYNRFAVKVLSKKYQKLLKVLSSNYYSLQSFLLQHLPFFKAHRLSP